MQRSKTIQREELLLTQIRKRKWISTHEAAKLLGISECSVRRLFTAMERSGEAVRRYGGIAPADRSGKNEYLFDDNQQQSTDEKSRIGKRGSQLVNSGDVIYIDSGTTMQQMALSLVKRLDRHELRNIQVFTNSLKNLTILSSHCDVNLIGGLFREHRQDFCGYLAEMMLGSISFKKCFLGADGIVYDTDDGIMATDSFTARINQVVAERAANVYLLADSSKFGRLSFMKYASLGQISGIITDSGMDEQTARRLEEFGCAVERM